MASPKSVKKTRKRLSEKSGPNAGPKSGPKPSPKSKKKAAKTAAQKLKKKPVVSDWLKQIYEIDSSVLFRPGDSGDVLVISTLNLDHFFRIDGHAAKLWSMIDGKTSLQALVDKLAKKVALPKAELTKAESFFKAIIRQGLIKKVT
jgi:hypothetical protein